MRAYALADGAVLGARGSNEEHRAIVDAVAARSPESLKVAIRRHLTNRLEYLRAFMAQRRAQW